jgi:quinol monooxygenase YgiN
MISLVSTWILKSGCPENLHKELQSLAGKVEEAESDTLVYLINLQSDPPLNSQGCPIQPPPQPISLEDQKAVVFIEMYKDVDAFSQHVTGKVFTEFLSEFKDCFESQTAEGSSSRENTNFLVRQSGFIRPGVIT